MEKLKGFWFHHLEIDKKTSVYIGVKMKKKSEKKPVPEYLRSAVEYD